MTRLLDLLHSLTAVIVRYHDAHASEKLIVESNATILQRKARELSPTLLSKEDFDEYLKGLIRKCTDGYETRKPLLHYLVHEITFVKTMLERRESFSEQELIQFKQQIAQMLIDLKQLLSTNKSAFYKVSYSKLGKESAPAISLSGVKNDSYYGGKYCFSGDLINELLERFHFSSESSNEELRVFAEDICLEHQNSLLVPELAQAKLKQEEALQVEKSKVSALTAQVETLTLGSASQKSELEKALERVKALESQLQEEASKVAALRSKVETLTGEATIAAERIKTLEEATGKKTSVSDGVQTEPTLGKIPLIFNPALLYGPTMFALASQKRLATQQKKPVPGQDCTPPGMDSHL